MERNVQSAREFDDRAEPRLALSPLKQSDLCAVKRCHFAERLLGDFRSVSAGAETVAETDRKRPSVSDHRWVGPRMVGSGSLRSSIACMAVSTSFVFKVGDDPQ